MKALRTLIVLLVFAPLLVGWVPQAHQQQAQPHELFSHVHTTQADWMAGERSQLDVRTLDALGTPYGLDQDPRGAMRLHSQPGPWTPYAENPVIVPGEEDAWDDAVISEAKIIYDGEIYYAWYAGRKRGPPGLKMPMDLGYATSPDGIHWEKPIARAVLVRGPIGSYDENMITAPAVIYDGENYRMWFSSVNFRGTWSINYASSSDGITWHKHTANPLLEETHDDRWDADYVAEPTVLYNGTQFEMWYNGASSADSGKETVLGYASSADGVTWERFPENRPVLDVGAPGEWDDYAVARASVMFDGTEYKMWYEGHSGETWRIGYATSQDGIEWERFSGNPIVELGPAESWNSKVSSEPFVLFDGQSYRLYHSGYDGDRYRVGLVTAPAVYDSEGSFTSPAIESETSIEWGTIAADVDLPADTSIRFEVATSDDGETWTSWQEAPCEPVSGITKVDLTSLGLPKSTHLRYRITLTTGTPAVSPVVRSVTVGEAAPDFKLSLSGDTVSLLPGEQAQVEVTLDPIRGFDTPVHIEIVNPAKELYVTPVLRPVSLPDTISLNIIAGPDAAAGSFTLQVSATSGEIEHQASITVSMLPLAASPTPQPVPTPRPTLAPLPTPEPLPSVNPRPLYTGIGIAGGSLALTLVWLVALLFTNLADRRHGSTARRRWWQHWVWAVLLIVALAAGVYVAWQYISVRRIEWETYQSHIRPGVTVAGIPAGGMTEQEIRETIQERAIDPLARDIVVRYGNQSTILSTSDLPLQTNLEQVVEQALTVHEQDPEQAFREFLTRSPAPFDTQLPLTYTYDLAPLVPMVETIANEVYRPVVPHTWDAATLTFVRGQSGVTLEMEDALTSLEAAVPDPEVREVTLPLTEPAPADWTDDEIARYIAQAKEAWTEPPLPAVTQVMTIPFDYERWISANAKEEDWQPTRPMTGYTFLPGQMGWELDERAAQDLLRKALDTDVPAASVAVFREVAPPDLTLADIQPALLEIAGHFDGLTGLYVQDLTTGKEIRHQTYVTTSGMSMIKVAIMATAYRTLQQPFDAELQEALSDMVAHSINEKSNYVLLQIGEGDMSQGLARVNETLSGLGMHQSYIASAYRVPDGPSYDRIPVPERPPAEIPPEERIDLLPDPAMRTSLSDQVILFQGLYRGAQGSGALLEAFPNLTPADCQTMLDLLKTNPTRTLLGPGFSDEIPMAHKNGFGGGAYTDERMDVGIVWPENGRPYLVGIYQWDKVAWIHWLRVWPQQIELSTTLYRYFTMPSTRPSPDMPTSR